MLEIFNKCFPEQKAEWEPKIREMVPSYGVSLVDNPELFKEIHEMTDRALGLNETELATTATVGAEAKSVKEKA